MGAAHECEEGSWTDDVLKVVRPCALHLSVLSSARGTVLDHTALTAAVRLALVGLALSTPETVLDHTALAAAMLDALA